MPRSLATVTTELQSLAAELQSLLAKPTPSQQSEGNSTATSIMDARFTALQNRIADINGAIATLQEMIDGMQTSLAAMEQDVTRMNAESVPTEPK